MSTRGVWGSWGGKRKLSSHSWWKWCGALVVLLTACRGNGEAADSALDTSHAPPPGSLPAPATGIPPQLVVLDSLNLEPELIFPLLGQVNNLQVTDDWLYFSGRIHTVEYPESLPVDGMGVFRMKKEVNARPEALFAVEASTLPVRFYWDGKRVYYQDWERVVFWEETAPGTPLTLQGVPLEGRYDYIGGDDETVFSYSNNCVRITLIDKQTLQTRLFTPPNAWAAGGAFGATSDGTTLYCTGRQEKGNRPVIYALNKGSSEIRETPILHEGNGNSLFISPGFIEDGSLFQIMNPYFFGKLNLTTGVFTPLKDDFAWSPVPNHRAPGSPYVYWVGADNVWRYDLRDNSYDPFVSHELWITGRSSMDERYVYFVMGEDLAQRPNDPKGIVRIEKPPEN